VSEFVCLLPINSAPYRLSTRVIHILNQRDPGSALVHNSFALTVCWEVPLWHKF